MLVWTFECREEKYVNGTVKCVRMYTASVLHTLVPIASSHSSRQQQQIERDDDATKTQQEKRKSELS